MELYKVPSDRPNQNLSSRNPSTPTPRAVRLPPHLDAMIDAACQEQGISASELIRAIIEQWAYGSNALAGPDAGYSQARSMASQLAHAALRKALASLPATHEDAEQMLEGYQGELSGARKRT